MKLTEKDIENCIYSESVYTLGRKTTAVLLVLTNGFEVVGTAACVDPAEYDQEVGRPFARKKAIDKIWELEGYKAQCDL